MLEIKELKKYYGKSRGIESITISLNAGEIFGFIGPNASGKSTTIRLIMTLINQNKGIIKIDNQEVFKDATNLKEKIGYLPSEINLYENLTVKQMLDYNQTFYKKDLTERQDYLVKELELDLTKKISDLSFGNKKKVGIVLALVHEPTLLILDEPTSGLDPLMQEKLYHILNQEKKKGTTILFSTHILSEIKKICDRVGIIKDGQIIKTDTVDNFIKNELIKVTIKMKNIEKISKHFQENIVYQTDEEIKFMTNDINNVIKILKNYQVDKLLIEEPKVEEIFVHFYK